MLMGLQDGAPILAHDANDVTQCHIERKALQLISVRVGWLYRSHNLPGLLRMTGGPVERAEPIVRDAHVGDDACEIRFIVYREHATIITHRLHDVVARGVRSRS